MALEKTFQKSNNGTLPSMQVSGWSVKTSRVSLFRYLNSCAYLTKLTHYPQLNATHLAGISGSLTADLARSVQQHFAKTRVSLGKDTVVQDTEYNLESPEFTAFIRSRHFFDELEVHSALNSFGNIRAITFVYSSKTNHWYCKVSYYESHSLENLLRSTKATPCRLSNGAYIKVERFKKSITTQVQIVESPVKRVGEAEAWVLRPTRLFLSSGNETLRPRKVNPDNIITKTSSRLNKCQKKIYFRKSKSASRTPVQCLPHPEMFADRSVYLENVLSIAKSKRNESQRKKDISHGDRSKSLSKKETQQNFFKVVMPSKAKRSKKQRQSSKTLLIEENEYLFLQIRSSNIPSSTFPKQVSFAEALAPSKIGGSYLSQDDLSDGFTTIEGNFSSFEIRRSLSSHHSGKHSSLKKSTNNSSEAEHTFLCRNSPNSGFSGYSTIDEAFDSNTVEEKVYLVGQTTASGPQQYRHHINNNDFWIFPCN